VGDSRKDFVKLKEPIDIINYCQRLINRLRREDLELDPVYIGKIIYLLNTWLAAYKTQMESIELKALKQEVEEIKTKLEANYHEKSKKH
jgi:hypothetical protein